MDTSTSDDERQADRVINGAEPPEQTQITQGAWVRIVNRQFDLLKPQIKYMKKLKPLGEFLAYKEQDGPTVLYEYNPDLLPEDVDHGERMLLLCYLNPGDEAASSDGHCKKMLFADTRGDLLSLEVRYSSEWKGTGHRKLHNTAESIRALHVSFGDLDLCGKSCSFGVGFEVLGAELLSRIFIIHSETIQAKRQILHALETTSEKMEGPITRIKNLRNCVRVYHEC